MKLQHIKKKLSLAFAIILGTMALNPGKPAQAFDRNIYDQDGDGTFSLEDENILLDAVVNNTVTTGPSLDVNVDGHVGIEDLYLITTFIHPVDTSGVQLEGRHERVTDVHLQTKENEDRFEVQINLDEHKAFYGYLDYAIMYDREKLKVEDVQWSIDFQYHFRNKTPHNNYIKKDTGDYVTFAGYYMGNTAAQMNTLATITFSYLDEEKQPGEVELIKNASKFDDTLELLKGYLKEPSVLCGDMNGNEQIDLDDALLMLRAALSIDRVEQSEIKSKHLDTDRDGELTLWDAATILRIALNIEHPTYDYSDPYI